MAIPYRAEDPSDGLPQYAPAPAPDATWQFDGQAPAASPSGTPAANMPWLEGSYNPSGNVTVSGTESGVGEGYVYVRVPTRTRMAGTYGHDSLKGPHMQAQVTPSYVQPTSIEEVRSDILGLSGKKLKELQKKLGVEPTGFPDEATYGRVTEFLGYVSNINASGVKMGWEQVLNKISKEGTSASSSSGYGTTGFDGTRTTSRSNVTKYSPSKVQAAAEKTYISALGRQPTKAELAALRQALNHASEQNPVVSTTTTDYNNGRATDSHTVTEGGIDAGQKILNEARGEEGYAEYQALNYFNALQQALAAPVGA